MGIHSRKIPVPRRFYIPSGFFSELGLSWGRNPKKGGRANREQIVSPSTTQVQKLSNFFPHR